MFISGLSKPEILAIVKDEYQDVSFSEITYEVIDKLTVAEDLIEMRERFRLMTREHFQDQLKENLVKGRVTEQKILDLMLDKIEPVLNKLKDLDPVEQEEEFFKFLRRMGSLQGIIAKLSGTDSLRELEHAAKELRIKLALTPKENTAGNPVVDVEAVFMDAQDNPYALEMQ